MYYANIVANGDIPLTFNGQSTLSKEVTIYMPSVAGATVAIGYLDDTGTAVPYTDGAILAQEQKRVRCGEGANMVAIVTGFTSAFKIGYAP